MRRESQLLEGILVGATAFPFLAIAIFAGGVALVMSWQVLPGGGDTLLAALQEYFHALLILLPLIGGFIGLVVAGLVELQSAWTRTLLASSLGLLAGLGARIPLSMGPNDLEGTQWLGRFALLGCLCGGALVGFAANAILGGKVKWLEP